MAALIIGLVIVQRLLELLWARSNGRYMLRRGALEVGVEQYKFFILLHSSFFVVLLWEIYWWQGMGDIVSWWAFGIFILAQGLRIWCLASLGRFWNTRVYVLSGARVITKGPYKFFRHPNYLAVILELFFLPMAFGAWYTAIIFSIANGILLKIRISLEEWALNEFTDYHMEMEEKPRLLPGK